MSYKETTTMSRVMKQAAIATYSSHNEAEKAVRQLKHSGVSMRHISMLGRHWQARADVEGFYSPGDADNAGEQESPWRGEIFGAFVGMGVFILPIAGTLIVLGPLGGLIAGAVGQHSLGALVGGLVAWGASLDQAVQYQERVAAGEFLVVVYGTPEETTRTHELLHTTSHTGVTAHQAHAAQERAAWGAPN